VFFLRFDSFPLGVKFVLIADGDASEDVGMAPDHFRNYVFKNIASGELLLFRVHGNQHGENEENITDFFTYIFYPTMINSLQQFLAFFEEVSLHGNRRLLGIPWASIGASQGNNDLLQSGEIVRSRVVL